MQEKTYRRLLMLQNALTTMLPHHAGLNPRAFRYSPEPGSPPPHPASSWDEAGGPVLRSEDPPALMQGAGRGRQPHLWIQASF